MSMKKSKLDNPRLKDSVIKQLAVGTPQREIAEQVGLDRSQISRFANKQDVKKFIEQEQMRLLDVVPDAVESVMELIRDFKDTPKENTGQRKLIYKAISDVLKSVGLFTTPVQSQTLINIYDDASQTIFSPEVLEILRNHHSDIIDVDLGFDQNEMENNT